MKEFVVVASQDKSFVPFVRDGAVQLRPNYGIGVDLLVDRRLCYLREGACIAIVQWSEQASGVLVPKIYAPSAQLAALVPVDITLIKIAELREEGILADFYDVVAAYQTYWVADMRVGKKEGHSYFFSTDRVKNPSVPHLEPMTPYVFQEEGATSRVLSSGELISLVKNPPPNSLVFDEPSSTQLSTHQLYDRGTRLIVDDMTAVQRKMDASGA